MERHFAYFDQRTGVWAREWKGNVPEPGIDPSLVGDARLAALNEWQQRMAPAGVNEVGLDVTQFQWPLGDFCYCVFDTVTRLLDWGPDRHYLEIEVATLSVIANTRTHRPLRSAVPGQHVIDITGHPIAKVHGNIFGRFVQKDGRWVFGPDAGIVPAKTQRLLTEAPIDMLNIVAVPQSEYATVKEPFHGQRSRQATDDR